MRSEIEARVVATLATGAMWLSKHTGELMPKLFESEYLRVIAGQALQAYFAGARIDRTNLSERLSKKFPNHTREGFEAILGQHCSEEVFIKDLASLKSLSGKPAEGPRDSGKSGAVRDQAPPADAGDPRDAEDASARKAVGDAALANYDAEQALLGALMSANQLYGRISGILRPEDFADVAHARVYEAIGQLIMDGRKADPTTLYTRFKDDPGLSGYKGGSSQYLVDLAQAVVTIRDAPDYAQIIADLAARRRLLEELQALRDQTYQLDIEPNAIIARAMSEIPKAMTFNDTAILTKHQVREMIAKGVEEEGRFYSTGMPRLDAILGGGVYTKKLYALMARLKAGKTTAAGSISHAMNAAGTMHGFVSLEMKPYEIETRDVARDLDINGLRIMMGKRANHPVSGAAIAGTMPNTNNCTVYFGRRGATLEDIRSFLVTAKSRFGITGAIIDYHQLIRGRGRSENEEQHLRNSSDDLCIIADQLDMWILLLLQENQDGNVRGGEGVKLNCDAFLRVNRLPGDKFGWIALEVCRYMPSPATVGTRGDPGIELMDHGPWFKELPATEGTAPAPDTPPDPVQDDLLEAFAQT